MYHVTEACKQALNDPKRQTELYIKMLKADGSMVEIDGLKDVRLGTFTIDSQLWGNTFQLGTCVASDMSVTLDNMDGRWRADELLGATLMPFVKVKLDNALVESIPMGVFIVDRPGQPYNVLTIQAADRLVLLDEPLKDAVKDLNITNAGLLQAICKYCKVPVSTSTLTALNITHQIKLDEIPDNMSCRDAVSEIALMAGGFVRMNRQGELEIVTLDTSNTLATSETWGQQRLKKNTWGALKAAGKRWLDLNGLTNRSTYGKLKTASVTWGDLKKRGIPWKLLGNYDLDSKELQETWIVLPSTRYDLSQDTEPLTITGMTYKDLQWGTDDYVLSLSNLQLLDDSEAEAVLTLVWQKIKGLSYTPFSSNYIGNPALDPGDLVYHLGRKGLAIASYVGKHTYKHNAKSKISSGGKSKQELNYKSQNERRLVELSAQTKTVRKDLSNYQQSTAQMADMLSQALGVYGPTVVKQDNGANFYYLHDKPQLSESKTVWRFDGEWLAISDDGGKTWNGGISAQSKLVMRVIDAVKINTEQLQAGAVTADKIQANTITGDKLAFNTIKGDKIQANTITGNKLAYNTITGDKIQAGTITSNNIHAGTITGAEIQSKSIGADKIRVDEIMGRNATFSGTISGATIRASTISTTSLTTGSINGHYMNIATDGTSHSRYQQSDYMTAYNMSSYDMSAVRANAQTFNFQSGSIQSGVNIGTDMHVSPTGIYVNGNGYVCSFETLGNAWIGIHRGRDSSRHNSANLIWAVTTNGQVVTSDFSTKKELEKIDPQEATDFIKNLSYWQYKRKTDDVGRLGIVANFLKYSKSPLASYVLTSVDTRDGKVLAADYDQLAIINAVALKSVEERVTQLEKRLEQEKSEGQ